MVDCRNRNIGFLTKIVDGGDFRFCLQSWHESTANSCHELDVINQSDKISLDDEDSSSRERRRIKMWLIMYLMKGP